MQVLSLNVGLPKTVEWKGKPVSTGIFKSPVQGRIRVEGVNFIGDQQADLTVHGGPDKAVYVYPSEGYEYWRDILPADQLGWGAFGENLTTTGLSDTSVNIGDTFRIGTAEFIVTQPRFPCYKLNLKFGRDDMVKLFTHQANFGFYLFVLKEGEVGAGDTIERLSTHEQEVKVADILRLYLHDKNDFATMRRAVQVPALSGGWKDYFEERMKDEG